MTRHPELSAEDQERYEEIRKEAVREARAGLETAWGALHAAQEADQTGPSVSVLELEAGVDTVARAGRQLQEAKDLTPSILGMKAAS